MLSGASMIKKPVFRVWPLRSRSEKSRYWHFGNVLDGVGIGKETDETSGLQLS